DEDVTVGMSLTGAMTPAGLGMSTIIPLIEAGFVDWIVSTGANLYHDAHFGLGMAMHRGTPFADDVVLREEGVVRIYDIFFDYDVLLSTDRFVREVSAREEFQRPMSTAEYHYLPVTDARPDTAGLSGATPAEAVSWGKGDPDKLPGTVVAYLDNTAAFPILAAYALARRKPRKLKRLYERRGEMMRELTDSYLE